MIGISKLLRTGTFIISSVAFGAALTTSDLKALTIDLGFALDESGSISGGNWNLAKTGLANALSVIPTSGPNVYRISVVKFDNTAETVITRTITSAADITAVQSAITGANQQGGTTCISCGTALLSANIAALAGGFGNISLLNITTDGEPNVGEQNGSTLRGTTVAAGWDSISAEAVGVGSGGLAFLQNLVFPNPGATTGNPNALPNPLLQGFVLTVDNFADYQGAIGAKVQRIVDDAPGTTPIPGALPLFASGLGAIGFLTWRRKKKTAQAA
jgi:von Willebrand factor type A domain-containing protein